MRNLHNQFRNKIKGSLGALLGLFIVISFANLGYSQFQVTSTSPAIAENDVALTTNIVIDFNANTAPGTGDWQFEIISDQRGFLDANMSGGGTSTITLDPVSDFIYGEKITVYATSQVLNVALTPLDDYAFSFFPAIVKSNYLQTANLHVTPAGLLNGHYTRAVDLDGDGDMDMLGSDQNAGGIAWMENDGSENFTTHQIHTGIGIASLSVHVADIDSDGDVDFLFTDNGLGAQPLKWYSNDGNQNFTLTTVNATITGQTEVDLADMDGDGDMDIVVFEMGANQLSWLENDGAQNFSVNAITASPFCWDVKVFDVDNDGDMDLLTSTSTSLSWYENDGSQNFTVQIIDAVSSDFRGIDCADMDNDGDVDVVSATGAAGEILWYENDGSENFSTQVIATGIAGMHTVEAADMDGDGLMDVVAGANHLFWYRADRMQNFYGYEIGNQSDVMNYTHLDAADIDSDGDLDLAVYYEGTGGAANDFGWFEMSPMITTSPASHEENVSVSSNIVFSFDQDIDAAYVDSIYFTVRGQLTGLVNGAFSGGGTSTITFDPTTDFLPGELITVTVNENVQRTTGNALYGHHSFNFRAAAVPYGFVPTSYTKHLVSDALVQISATVPVDLDNDGDMDVIGINQTSGELLWYENDGAQIYTEILISAVTSPYDVSAVDLDDDGDMDVLVASLDNSLYWFENDGSQNFTIITFPAVPLSSGGFKTMYPADMDGDGDVDVVGFAFSPSGQVLWFENDGSENFTFRSIELNSGGYTVHPIDMDGDGDLDIVSSNSNSSELIWYENDEQMFTVVHTISTGAVGDHDGIYAIDADGDGDVDVFSCSITTLIYHENIGNQVFVDQVMETSIYPDGEIYAMDIDADLDVDLLFASGASDTLSWYQNDGSQNFTKKVLYTSLGDPTDVFPADMDGDGDMDVLSNSRLDGESFWLEFACTEADEPVVTAPSSICLGFDATLAWTGNLNDATQWVIRTGSCSGPIVDSTTANTIDLNPLVTTTYYILGEGGCSGSTCATITINVNSINNQTVAAATSTFCNNGGSTTIDLGSSETGINYYLRDDTNDTIVDGPLVGTGSGISLNTGNISNTTTYNVYSLNSSSGLSFDGINDFITAQVLDFSAGNTMTIEAWVQPDDIVTNVYYEISRQDGSLDWLLSFQANGTILSFGLDAGGSYEELDVPIVASNFTDGNWHHIVAVYDGSNKYLYVDGLQIGMQAKTGNVNNGGVFHHLGRRPSGTEFFNGRMDDIRFWNTARSQSQIQDNMHECLSGTEPGLVAYYDFEDGTGSSTLTDKTGNGYNGALSNMDPATDWVYGIDNCAFCDLEMTQTVTVTVLPALTGNDNTTICATGSVVINGTTYNAANSTGTEVFTNVGPNNCDSTVTVALNVNPVYNEVASATICSSEAYTFPDGSVQTITAQTIQTSTLQSVNSCDSIIVTTVDINPVYNEVASATVCEGEDYTFPDGSVQTINVQTVQVSSLQSVNSCDSIITTTVDIIPVYNETANATICNGDSYTFGAQTLTTAGPYTEVFQSVAGCDSTVDLTLVVTIVDAGVSVSGITITADATGSTYQWVDCDNGNSDVNGETSQSFTPTINGNYAVEVTENGCTETSACEIIDEVGILENNINMSILVYPNPNEGKFYLEVKGTNNEMFSVEMLNNLGQVVYSDQIMTNDTKLIELADKAPGIYTIRIGNENTETRKKVVIQ
ncbi:MAG: FG-GAP-like repeat-containing protein [Crocinitomicaceae bacterium]|nr:FG-GAP-like repeat-containing protein [Crocinitomicaceae bacterium]